MMMRRDKHAQEFESAMMARARILAQSNTLSELAEIAADYAPEIRNKYATTARIPWQIIYAIRIKQRESSK